MKKVITLIHLILLLCICIPAQAQEVKTTEPKTESNTKFNFQQQIKFEEHNQEEETFIDIPEGVKLFRLNIKSTVRSGKMTIEIYDVNNKKQGTFSVGTQLDSKVQEMATGDITKSLKNPESGKWKIKIIPIKASATVKIRLRSITEE